MKKRLVALVLSTVLVATMLGGCGSKSKDANNTTPTKAPTNSDKTEGNDKAEGNGTGTNTLNLPTIDGGVLKLTISIADFNQSSEGTEVHKLWEQKMEEYLGVDLDITWQRTPYADYRANELVILQSGDIPDVATYTQGSAISKFGQDDIVLNIADYSQYIKYYWDYVEDTNGGSAYAKNEDGSMYYFMDGFYNTDNIMGAQSFTGFAYRFDILKEHNLVPATTLDEFTKLCETLKGLIDTGKIDAKYVLMNSTKDYAFYRGFTGIFHTWDTLYWNGNEWKFGPIEDNFREMLVYIANLYKAGYIDPEMGTADFNASVTKATTGVGLVCPTLWAGSAATWNTAANIDGLEWGLSYLPTNEKYGTAWKWGSRQDGKSLNQQMGIYISADVKHPEYVVAMIDYQYSDEMVELMNWGIKDTTYTVEDGSNKFVDSIMSSSSPATEVANYGIMSSSVCRSGIPFTPLDFKAMTEVSSIPEPWWNETDGYYEGKYWIESSKIGGEESVAPADRPPVVLLTADESSTKSQLSRACEGYAKEYSYKFITGELDINNDAIWNQYIKDVKSQSEMDFDEVLAMLQEKTVLNK